MINNGSQTIHDMFDMIPRRADFSKNRDLRNSQEMAYLGVQVLKVLQLKKKYGHH